MRTRLVLAGLVGLAACLAACLGGGLALSWHAAIAGIAPPPRAAFAPDTVVRGAELAAIGDCAVCHTAGPGHAGAGRPFAGGRPLATPFGTVFVTNITPDPQTGIGTWSEAAFRRAMRDGIGRTGRHLYPALPYPHFTRASDADIAALYAFLMTRAPVRASTPPNRLPFPLNLRVMLTGWNLLFLRPGPWQPDPARSAEWNRGAYLVEGVGHCGACHSPHNPLGAEQAGRALGGGVADGWSAPPLVPPAAPGLADAAMQPGGGPIPAASAARDPAGWTVEALTAYLRTGFAAQHGAAAGPMGAVTQELASVPEADVRAIAVYVLSQPLPAGRATAPAPGPTPTAERDAVPTATTPVPAALQADAAVFAGACGACHAPTAPMTRGGAPSLALSTSVLAPSARNVVQVILHGIPWREGAAAPYMPGFADALSDAQVAGLARYLRAHFTDRPAWSDVDAALASARRDGGS